MNALNPYKLLESLLKELGQDTKPIASKKSGQFTLARVMHNDDPANWQNGNEVELFVQNVRFLKVSRHNVTVYTKELDDAIANGLVINTNKVEDKLRALVPSVWFVRVTGYNITPRWMVATPSDETNPYPTNMMDVPFGQVTLMPQRVLREVGHYDGDPKRYVHEVKQNVETIPHGAVPEHANGWSYNWAANRAKDAAFQRHRHNVRSKIRAAQRAYERVNGLFLLACGAKSWQDEAVRRQIAERQAEQMPVIRAWLKHNNRNTYFVDGVEYVDLYKGTTVRGSDPYSSGMSGVTGHVSYTPGTMPEAKDFSADGSCGRGLHMCATTTAVKRYVTWNELVICPVRVDEIQIIGWHPHNMIVGVYDLQRWDKVKVPAVRLPIKHQRDVIV